MWKKFVVSAGCSLYSICSFSQTIHEKMEKAYASFAGDSQLSSALISLYILDAKTGKVVFDKNSKVGMAPASTQKIITAAAAFALLGKDYRYKTELNYNQTASNGVLTGNLFLVGHGDPTLGSWRYNTSSAQTIYTELSTALHGAGISRIAGSLVYNNGSFESGHIPKGWIWEDLANYYGAGAASLNWRENQYDLILKPGRKSGDSVTVIRTSPLQTIAISNELITAGANSGDNAFIYFSPLRPMLALRGTVPCCVDSFEISGSVPDAPAYAAKEIAGLLAAGKFVPPDFGIAEGKTNGPFKTLYTHTSPALDSIIYWFLKKSINLYGEALLKTLAFEKTGTGATAKGITVAQDFWKQNGIDPGELNIYDGSGLSPLNRITTHAQANVLQFALRQPWFSSFYQALPEFNGMRLKSGTISDVKGFCGYHTSKAGTQYIIAFLVNNYRGPASALVNKMYAVLNILK